MGKLSVTQPPKHQADIILDQANPNGAAWYTVLDTTFNLRIISICGYCTWSGAPTSLEIKITIDGVVFIFAFANPVTTTWYYPYLVPSAAPANQAMGTTDNFLQRTFFLEGRSVKVEARTVGGASSVLYVTLRTAKY